MRAILLLLCFFLFENNLNGLGIKSLFTVHSVQFGHFWRGEFEIRPLCCALGVMVKGKLILSRHIMSYSKQNIVYCLTGTV